MTQKLETALPIVLSDGLATDKAVVLGSTLTVAGATTLTGVVTFAAVPVFSAGRTNPIYASSGNTSPTAAQSGGTFLFDSATGITFTLPAPVVGASYTFVVTTTVSSGNHKIITNAGTVLLQGVITSATTTASVFESVIGTSNIAVTMNGSTTGGLVGTQIDFRCLSATLWQVFGTNFTSSTTATPFATS